MTKLPEGLTRHGDGSAATGVDHGDGVRSHGDGSFGWF